MSLVIVGMDNTIVNIALPAIRHDFKATLSDLQWTVDAYLLVLASLLMLSGSTADRLGRRRTFQVGLAVFTLGSLLCSLAPDLRWLVAFRVLQAVGGSMLNPVAMSIISNVFTDARERAMAIGVWGGVFGLSMGLGPIVGGVLTESFSWRAIFWINLPIGLAAIVLTARFVPESRAERSRRLDLVGQALVALVLAATTYALIEAPRAGWVSAQTLGLLAVGVVAAVGLVRYEAHRSEPLIDPRFFRSLPFSAASAIAVCGMAAFGGFLFVNTLYLQDVRGYSPLIAGVCTLPLAVFTTVLAPLSGRITGTHGPRVPMLVGGTGMALGGALLWGAGAGTALTRVLAAYVLFAIGFGMLNAPITNTAVSGMPRSQAGVAAAVASTSRQVGAALGVAVVGSVLNSATGGSLVEQFRAAGDACWLVVAGLGVLVVLTARASTGMRARASVARVAHLFDGDEDDGSQVLVPGRDPAV
ncbi:MAG: DHA2 family efflux MFS transporter permease subunit [Jatrophihabitans sp.]|nr:MAG: DHA2 family efflux MFS transporter permease subunit [Jatrophihabitans sp.]